MKAMIRQEAEDLLAKCTFHAMELADVIGDMIKKEDELFRYHGQKPLDNFAKSRGALLHLLDEMLRMGAIQ
jgi:hypothetical protein